MLTTTSTAPGTGQGRPVGVAATAIASGGFGWVQVLGNCSVRAAASCAAYTQLNTVATSGVIDDDATAGARVIEGLVLTTGPGGAEATAVGYCQWPQVGRTL
jgi:hypothetical protein